MHRLACSKRSADLVVRQCSVTIGLWAIAFILLAAPPETYSAPLLVLETSVPSSSLAGHLSQYVDVTRRGNIEAISRSAHFSDIPGDANAGFSAAVHWYRFTLKRLPQAPERWLIEFGAPTVDDVWIYTPSAEGGWIETKLGERVPLVSRPFPARLNVVEVRLPADVPITMYVRAQSISALIVQGRVWQPEGYAAEESRYALLQGGFFGVLIFSAVVFLVFAIWMRTREFLLYATYVLMLGISYFGLNGFAGLVLPPSRLLWLDAITACGVLGSVVVGTAMWGTLLDLRTDFPRLQRVGRIIAWLMIPAFLTIATPAYRIAAPLVILAGGSMIWAMFALLIWRLVNGRRPVEYYFYFVAFVLTNVGVAARILMVLGWIPLNNFSAHSYQLSSFVHVLVMNMAMARLLRKTQLEKLDAEHRASTAASKLLEQRQFSAMLSHEFRTPLAAISRTSQLLMCSEEGRVERLQIIRQKADGLYALIDRFLSTEATENPVRALQQEPVVLHHLIQGVIENFEKSDQTRIRIKLIPENATCSLDREFFSIVLSNLIDNALRYSSHKRRVSLTIKVKHEKLVVAVADRGIGMSEEELKRVTAPYFRATRASRMKKGFGLGLALTEKIIHAHGGEISFSSIFGFGLTVTVTLPLL